MKVYEAVYSEREDQGVYGISLVENPAMQDEWIALSEQKQELEFSAIDEKRRLLLGAVLIPDKKIYRNMGGNEFYITFNEQTIGQLAHDFIKKGFQNNSSEEHETKLQDVSFVESWQVEDSQKDKSALYGKNYPKGTWVTMAKVSPEIYEKATNGTFKGFSIDALLSLQEINLKSDNMNDEAKKSFLSELKEDIKALFTSQKEEVEEVNEVENIEVQPEEADANEAVEAVEATDRDFDIEAFKAEVMEVMKAELKSQHESEVNAKDEQIKELEAKLANQVEEETVAISPEVKQEVKLNEQVNFKREGIKQRVFKNLAENLW